MKKFLLTLLGLFILAVSASAAEKTALFELVNNPNFYLTVPDGTPSVSVPIESMATAGSKSLDDITCAWTQGLYSSKCTYTEEPGLESGDLTINASVNTKITSIVFTFNNINEYQSFGAYSSASNGTLSFQQGSSTGQPNAGNYYKWTASEDTNSVKFNFNETEVIITQILVTYEVEDTPEPPTTELQTYLISFLAKTGAAYEMPTTPDEYYIDVANLNNWDNFGNDDIKLECSTKNLFNGNEWQGYKWNGGTSNFKKLLFTPKPGVTIKEIEICTLQNNTRALDNITTISAGTKEYASMYDGFENNVVKWTGSVTETLTFTMDARLTGDVPQVAYVLVKYEKGEAPEFGVPSKPSNINIDVDTKNITWDPSIVEEGATGTIKYRLTFNNDITRIVGGTSFNFRLLNIGIGTHTVSIVAINDDDVASSEDKESEPATETFTIAYGTPSAPANVSVDTDAKIITWNASTVASGETGDIHYEVTIGDNAPVTVTGTSYDFSSLNLPDGTYNVSVVAVNGDQKSAATTVQFTIEPTTPPSLEPGGAILKVMSDFAPAGYDYDAQDVNAATQLATVKGAAKITWDPELYDEYNLQCYAIAAGTTFDITPLNGMPVKKVAFYFDNNAVKVPTSAVGEISGVQKDGTKYQYVEWTGSETEPFTITFPEQSEFLMGMVVEYGEDTPEPPAPGGEVVSYKLNLIGGNASSQPTEAMPADNIINIKGNSSFESAGSTQDEYGLTISWDRGIFYNISDPMMNVDSGNITLTPDAGVTIKKVTFGFYSSTQVALYDGDNEFEYDGLNATWTGESSTPLVIRVGEKIGWSNIYIDWISVEYEKEESSSISTVVAGEWTLNGEKVKEATTVNDKEGNYVLPTWSFTDGVTADKIEFTSSDENIAKISADGVITIVPAATGEVTLTAAPKAGVENVKAVTLTLTVKYKDPNLNVIVIGCNTNNTEVADVNLYDYNYTSAGSLSANGVEMSWTSDMFAKDSNEIMLAKWAGGSFTITAPTGYKVSNILISMPGASDSFVNGNILTPNTGSYSYSDTSATRTYTWVGNDESVTFNYGYNGDWTVKPYYIMVTYKSAAVVEAGKWMFNDEAVTEATVNTFVEGYAVPTWSFTDGVTADEVAFTSSNTEIATVDANGIITIVEGATGEVTLTAAPKEGVENIDAVALALTVKHELAYPADDKHCGLWKYNNTWYGQTDGEVMDVPVNETELPVFTRNPKCTAVCITGSSNESVCTVSSNVLKIVGQGETTLNTYDLYREFTQTNVVLNVTAPLADPNKVEAPIMAVADGANTIAWFEGFPATPNTVFVLSSYTEGAEFYYTLDGTEPTTEYYDFNRYDIPFDASDVDKTYVIKAIAVKDGKSSEVSEFNVTIHNFVLVDNNFVKFEDAEYFVIAAPSSATQAKMMKSTATGYSGNAGFTTINGRYTAEQHYVYPSTETTNIVNGMPSILKKETSIINGSYFEFVNAPVAGNKYLNASVSNGLYAANTPQNSTIAMNSDGSFTINNQPVYNKTNNMTNTNQMMIVYGEGAVAAKLYAWVAKPTAEAPVLTFAAGGNNYDTIDEVPETLYATDSFTVKVPAGYNYSYTINGGAAVTGTGNATIAMADYADQTVSINFMAQNAYSTATTFTKEFNVTTAKWTYDVTYIDDEQEVTEEYVKGQRVYVGDKLMVTAPEGTQYMTYTLNGGSEELVEGKEFTIYVRQNGTYKYTFSATDENEKVFSTDELEFTVTTATSGGGMINFSKNDYGFKLSNDADNESLVGGNNNAGAKTDTDASIFIPGGNNMVSLVTYTDEQTLQPIQSLKLGDNSAIKLALPTDRQFTSITITGLNLEGIQLGQNKSTTMYQLGSFEAIKGNVSATSGQVVWNYDPTSEFDVRGIYIWNNPVVTRAAGAPAYINTISFTTDRATGVDSVATETIDVIYFDLQGHRVDTDRLAPGIYIRVVGNEATKVLVK